MCKPVPDAFMRKVIEESMKLPAFVWRAALRSQMDESFASELPRIRAKAMLVWGERDAYFPYQEQLELAALLSHSELHVLRGVGHALHWEEPETVAGLLTRFVQSIPSIAA